MRKSIHTRQCPWLLLSCGCLTVKTTKTEPRNEIHSKNTMRKRVQNGHKHANFHYKGKAKAHCKDVQDQTLVINILQLVVKKGKKVQNIFSKQSVVYFWMATNMQISTIGEKAKAHCKDVQDQTLVKNILQLVVKKGKKGPKHFFKTIGRSLHQAPPRSSLV